LYQQSKVTATCLDPSPLNRQKYLKPALKQYCPNILHEKPNGFCKTRWVETFGELYENEIICLDGMVNPHVYPELNESRWNWVSDTKPTAHGLNSSLQSFGVIVGFTVLKNSLNYLKGLSANLQRIAIDI